MNDVVYEKKNRLDFDWETVYLTHSLTANKLQPKWNHRVVMAVTLT